MGFFRRTNKKTKDGRSIFKCRCGYEEEQELPQGKFKPPNVLLFDIETSKAVFKLYHTGNQYVRHDQMTIDNYVLGWAAKWLFDDKMYSSFVKPHEARNRDETRVVRNLHKLLDKADVVIAHNGDEFDIKEITARFTKYDLSPVNRFATVDTLKKAKQIYRVQSYSLRFLLEYFSLIPKGERCDPDGAEDGNKQALLQEEEYCRRDVLGLEELYIKMRPYMKTHPKLSLWLDMYQPLDDGDIRCPRCLEIISEYKWNKEYRTPSGVVYHSTNCPTCRTVIRGRRKA